LEQIPEERVSIESTYGYQYRKSSETIARKKPTADNRGEIERGKNPRLPHKRGKCTSEESITVCDS